MKKTTTLLMFLSACLANISFAQTTTQITPAYGRFPTAACLDANGDIWTLEYTVTSYGVAQYDASNSYARTERVTNELGFGAGDYPSDIEASSNGDIFYIESFSTGGTGGDLFMLDASNSYARSTLKGGIFATALGIDASDNLYVMQYSSEATTGLMNLVQYTAASNYASSSTIATNIAYSSGGDVPRGLG